MVLLPAVIVEDLSADVANVFKSIFDTFWQAVGWGKSLNYDKDGNWRAHT